MIDGTMMYQLIERGTGDGANHGGELWLAECDIGKYYYLTTLNYDTKELHG